GFTLRGRLFLLLSQGELGGETGGQGRDEKEFLPHDEFSKKTQELTNSRCVDLQHQPEALARPSLTLRVSGLPNHARSVRAPYRNVQCVAVMAIYVEGGFRQSSVSRAAPWPTGLTWPANVPGHHESHVVAAVAAPFYPLVRARRTRPGLL